MEITHLWHKKLKENISGYRFMTWQQAQKFQSNNMFKEVQQQAHGIRARETPLTSWRTHKIFKKNEEYLGQIFPSWVKQMIVLSY